MYIFKYIPDQIYRNGKYISTYDDFLANNPEFPLLKGSYFEYGQDKFVTINNQGHDVAADIADYQPLINAINNLEAING